MSIALTASERIARIRSDFRMGVAVGFRLGLEKWLVASSETITVSRFNGMRKLGSLELAITDWRAQTLSTWATDGDIARLAIPDDKDLDWVHSVCDPSDDFNTPLKEPFIEKMQKDENIGYVAQLVSSNASAKTRNDGNIHHHAAISNGLVNYSAAKDALDKYSSVFKLNPSKNGY